MTSSPPSSPTFSNASTSSFQLREPMPDFNIETNKDYEHLI